MPQTVSQQIYRRFFENLTALKTVKLETLAALKALYARDRLTNARDLAKLVQDIEKRHAYAQDADG